MRISTKTISLMASSVFAIGVAAGAVGCSSSSSSSNYVALCEQTCNKEVACLGDAGAGLGITASLCMSQCMSQQSQASTCSNAAQISAAVQKCNGMSDCTQFMACLDAIPDCQGGGATGGTSGTHTGGTSGTHTGGTSGTGTGGTSSTGTGGAAGHAGAGGSTGAAGSAGAADCSTCDKFVSSGCCAAVATQAGSSSAQCSAISTACAAAPSSIGPYCQQGQASGKAGGIAACQ